MRFRTGRHVIKLVDLCGLADYPVVFGMVIHGQAVAIFSSRDNDFQGPAGFENLLGEQGIGAVSQACDPDDLDWIESSKHSFKLGGDLLREFGG